MSILTCGSLHRRRMLKPPCMALAALFFMPGTLVAATEEALLERIRMLEAELQVAHDKLQTVQEEKENLVKANSPIQLGNLRVGGAIRANFTLGDYPESSDGAASRAWGDSGNFSLDTFRINLDYENGPYLAKLEYRWYDGYNFVHTAWLGYNFDEHGQLQIGVNRVPFGPGPYGVSKSWLFDQHYYLGLSDDMDLGIKYSTTRGNWSWDLAYYLSDEGHYKGLSRQSARYSYDVVDESGEGYEERHQFNLRSIYHLSDGEDRSTDLGLSLQYSELKSNGQQSDGDHYAVSLHMVNRWNNLELASQLTRYAFDVDARQSLGTDQLVQFGAYDFPSTAAAEAWLPAISLSYTHFTESIDWLDYLIPYIEYSSVIKDESEFNNSELFIIGLSLARNGWYIYNDLAFSNGNEFVGGDTAFGDRLGANADNDWVTRFNINLGYYF